MRQEQQDEEEYRQPDTDQQRNRESLTNGHVVLGQPAYAIVEASAGETLKGYTFLWLSHHSRNLRKAAPRWLYFAFSSALSSANVFRIFGK